MISKTSLSQPFGLLLAAVVVSGTAWGTEAPLAKAPLATLQVGAAGIEWQPQVDHERLVLTVSGPGGFLDRKEFAAGTSPSFSIYAQDGSLLPDGSYKYELRLVPRVDAATQRAQAAARESGEQGFEAPLFTARTVQRGHFALLGGELVLPGLKEGEAEAKLGNLTQKVVLSTSDGVIRNSLCVGFDCPNSPSFSDTTILLMENNTRIKFDDTSSTASFPNNDWELEANSSLNGGPNRFALNDCGTSSQGGCADDPVFAVEAGARANALFVEDDGDIGFGTATPVVDLHYVSGNTPTLRLDQDASSGFTPQVWDVAGNETNFFVRDVTGGSRLPLRIRPGAPTNSIFIDVDGDVGLGTSAPGAALHLNEATGAFANVLQLTNNSGVGFILDNTTGNDVFISVNNAATAYTVNFDDGDGPEFSLDTNGNITGVSSCVNCSAPSDRNLKENFAPVDRAAILQALLALDVQTWNYKQFNPEERHIGPVSQDFHALFNVGRDVTLNPVDTFGVAVAAIQALSREVSELRQLLDQALAAKSLASE